MFTLQITAISRPFDAPSKLIALLRRENRTLPALGKDVESTLHSAESLLLLLN